jgi:hypothetical protein
MKPEPVRWSWNGRDLFIRDETDDDIRRRVANLPEEYLMLRDVLGIVSAYFSGNERPVHSPLTDDIFSGHEHCQARHTAGLIRLVEKALEHELNTEDVNP